MKVLKILALVAVVSGLTACGSGSTPIIGSNPYGYNNGYSYGTTGTQTGYNTYSVPGGTKTLIPVLSGTAYMSGSRNFTQTAQVQAGDQIVVNANYAGVYAQRIGGVLSYSAQGYVNQLKVAINGQLVGAGTQAQYTAAQSGTLSLSFEWSGVQMYAASEMQFQVSFGTGGVYIGRCTSTSGQPMNCPPGY